MERQTIETMTAFIPPSELGAIPADEEIWEENDRGAHFKVTRHILPLLEPKVEVLSMTLSGEASDRRRIIEEFSEVFGAPADAELNTPVNNEIIDTVVWIAP
jgi:hypothetical protein